MPKWQKVDRQDRKWLALLIVGTTIILFIVGLLRAAVMGVDGSGRWLYPLLTSLGWIVCGILVATVDGMVPVSPVPEAGRRSGKGGGHVCMYY
jgi:hypothetical protein